MQGMLGNVVLAVYLEGIRRSCDKHLLPFMNIFMLWQIQLQVKLCLGNFFLFHVVGNY